MTETFWLVGLPVPFLVKTQRPCGRARYIKSQSMVALFARDRLRPLWTVFPSSLPVSNDGKCHLSSVFVLPVCEVAQL